MEKDFNKSLFCKGKECCIFDGEITTKMLRGLTRVKSYGDLYYMDDGYRELLKCPHCGAYFLHQVN